MTEQERDQKGPECDTRTRQRWKRGLRRYSTRASRQWKVLGLCCLCARLVSPKKMNTRAHVHACLC